MGTIRRMREYFACLDSWAGLKIVWCALIRNNHVAYDAGDNG